MADLIGLRDLMDGMGMPFDEQRERQRVVNFLNTNKVPFLGFGQNRQGRVRGILISAKGLADTMEARLARKARMKRKRRHPPSEQGRLEEAVAEAGGSGEATEAVPDSKCAACGDTWQEKDTGPLVVEEGTGVTVCQACKEARANGTK